MEIPVRFRVNKTLYTVHRWRTHNHLGYINYDSRDIVVSTHRPSTGNPLSKKLQAQTFWHEVTHAILKDMGHPLEGNEKFVDNFAKRLNDVVHSAEL